MSEQDHVRLRAFFSGSVQGVGFRFTTIHIAQGHDVAGFVKNLGDGRVELTAEGTKEELENFLTAVQERMRRHIHSTESSWLPAGGEFTRFQIQY